MLYGDRDVYYSHDPLRKEPHGKTSHTARNITNISPFAIAAGYLQQEVK